MGQGYFSGWMLKLLSHLHVRLEIQAYERFRRCNRGEISNMLEKEFAKRIGIFYPNFEQNIELSGYCCNILNLGEFSCLGPGNPTSSDVG